MRRLNTLPIEEFLDRARVAIKTNQKSVTLTIKEVTDLQNSLAVVMTRLSGDLDQIAGNIAQQPSTIQVKVDGGSL
jgi:flagellar motor protein MotB